MNAHNDMTLRDWFAGMAMQGLISILECDKEGGVAAWAYGIADAMLAEREKTP